MKISKTLKKKIENILNDCNGCVFFGIPLHHYGKDYIIASNITENKDGYEYISSYALYLEEKSSIYNTLITLFTINENKFTYFL